MPLFSTADGNLLDDSWEILEFATAGGDPVPAPLRELLNERVGKPAAAIAYTYWLADVPLARATWVSRSQSSTRGDAHETA